MQKQVAEAHQQIQRAKAIDHKHFGMRHFGLKAVGDRQTLKQIDSANNTTAAPTKTLRNTSNA